MTNNVSGAMLGLLLATSGIVSGIESLLQAGVTLTGTGLMAWYVVCLQRELSAEREAHRKTMQDNLKMCKTCKLANLSNDTTAKLIHEHINEHNNDNHRD